MSSRVGCVAMPLLCHAGYFGGMRMPASIRMTSPFR
jgi:hypothetical protein